MRITATLAAVLAGIALVGPPGRAGAQEVYRWYDREGNVHYTQQPPPPNALRAPPPPAPPPRARRPAVPTGARAGGPRRSVRHRADAVCRDASGTARDRGSGRARARARGLPPRRLRHSDGHHPAARREG